MVDSFGDLLRSALAASKTPLVYPLYLASRAKRGLLAAKADPEGIISEVGSIESLGNSRYAIQVSDLNGATYRVTIEHVSDYDGPKEGIRY